MKFSVNQWVHNWLLKKSREPLFEIPAATIRQRVRTRHLALCEMLDLAIVSVETEYAKQGRRPSRYQVVKVAFLACAIAVMDGGIESAELPKGSDKVQHYFFMGWLALQVYGWWPLSLGSWPLASALVLWFGRVKEHLDPTGYDQQDLRANLLGVDAARTRLRKELLHG